MDLNSLIEKIVELEEDIEAHKRVVKGLNEQLGLIENQAIEALTALNLTSVKHEKGTLILTTRFSVKNPATPEDKKAFYDYLKEKQLFENMVSVNSNSLNAWYKAEMEAAKQSGDFGFKVPGIAEPSAYQQVSLRSNR